MNETIQKEMEILWADFDDYSVDQKLAAFERLKKAASKKDIPQLIELMKSDKNDFWTRELLSEPIIQLGGPKYLSLLFDALSLNEKEGHDNDGFRTLLTEMAELQPEECKAKLESLLSEPGFRHKRDAEWLLAFCK